MNESPIRSKFTQKTLQKLPQVLTLYNDYQQSVQTIAKALKMSPMTVSNLLKQYGNGLRPSKIEYVNKVDRLGKEIEIMYYDQLMSTRQIAKRLGVEPNFVIGYLNKFSKGTRNIKESCQLRTNNEYRTKLREKQLGELNNSVKLTQEMVLKIREEYGKMLEIGHTKTQAQYYLANKYNVKRPTISDVVLRKTWKHI
ncbi:helix-turn-helix domain-containing protein [Cytobacillus sp.]|uniref:helix-turn-helix domain-containing protein n=1 Tax=Cytobacillus sp. TaxID=2675269 RepID=UPI0028BE3466|nr:helix-turn-helix domain-containing protein [Cytobacillus sp.]